MEQLKFSAISVLDKRADGQVVMTANGISFVVRAVDLRIYNQGRLTDFLIHRYEQARAKQAQAHKTNLFDTDSNTNIGADTDTNTAISINNPPSTKSTKRVTRKIQPSDLDKLELEFQVVTIAVVEFYDSFRKSDDQQDAV